MCAYITVRILYLTGRICTIVYHFIKSLLLPRSRSHRNILQNGVVLTQYGGGGRGRRASCRIIVAERRRLARLLLSYGYFYCDKITDCRRKIIFLFSSVTLSPADGALYYLCTFYTRVIVRNISRTNAITI